MLRGPHWWSTGVRTPLWWAALVVGGAAVALERHQWAIHGPTGVAALLAIGFAAEVVVGLLFWMWRPGNVVGPLLVTYVLLAAINTDAVPPDSRLGMTIGNLVGWVFVGVYMTMLLMFPTGVLWKRWLIGLLAFQFIWSLARFVDYLLFVPAMPMNFGASEVPSYFYVGHGWSGVRIYDEAWWVGQVVLLLVVDAVLVARLVSASPGARRRLLPLYAAVILFLTFDWVYVTVHEFSGRPIPAWFAYPWVGFFAVSAAGAAFVSPAFATRAVRSPISWWSSSASSRAGCATRSRARSATRRSCSGSGCPTAESGRTSAASS
jgi:hypothetical protein